MVIIIFRYKSNQIKDLNIKVIMYISIIYLFKIIHFYMDQIFFNFNFSMFYLNLTILDLVFFFTTILSVTLVILHMSGMGKKNRGNW